jgi:hypothetical protein
MAIAARIVRTGQWEWLGLTVPPGGSPGGTDAARPRRRAHCGHPWGAYCCGNQCGGFEVPIIVAAHSFRNFKSKDRTRIIKLLVSL